MAMQIVVSRLDMTAVAGANVHHLEVQTPDGTVHLEVYRGGTLVVCIPASDDLKGTDRSLNTTWPSSTKALSEFEEVPRIP